MSASYAGSGASFGYGRDEERVGDWSETSRDRDRGQGRRFWQREPLSARDVMTRNPKTVTRQTSIREAAVVMRDENCGVVPVVDAVGRLEGILTDRDIVVRGLIDESTLRRIEDVMTDDVSAVTEDEPLTSVLDLMGRKQIRRVPVVDRNDRLLGIISMADIANRADYDEDLQDAFERISVPALVLEPVQLRRAVGGTVAARGRRARGQWPHRGGLRDLERSWLPGKAYRVLRKALGRPGGGPEARWIGLAVDARSRAVLAGCCSVEDGSRCSAVGRFASGC